MKVAIFHDYLNQFGGAERVLKVFLEMFPDADLYTLLYDEKRTKGMFAGKVKGTSFLDNGIVRDKHRMFIPLMPVASYSVPVGKEYDLVISSSAGYAKGFGDFDAKNLFHVCYCHSPLRYAWELDYLRDLPNAPAPLTRFFAKPIAEILRKWDHEASKRVNVFIVNSNFISKKVESYYERDSHVVYPPVNHELFYSDTKSPSYFGEDYYMMAGRLLYYKMFDLGIKTFNRLNKPLKIIGSGPEFYKLKRLAGPKIEFLRDLTDDELRVLYSNAKGFIFPQVEDFGLVAAEAQSCGLPVIAFNGGGGREIVEDGKTGVLFNNQSLPSLMNAVKKAETLNFDREYIEKRAQMFSEDSFKEGIKEVLKNNGIVI